MSRCSNSSMQIIIFMLLRSRSIVRLATSLTSFLTDLLLPLSVLVRTPATVTPAMPIHNVSLLSGILQQQLHIFSVWLCFDCILLENSSFMVTILSKCNTYECTDFFLLQKNNHLYFRLNAYLSIYVSLCLFVVSENF